MEVVSAQPKVCNTCKVAKDNLVRCARCKHVHYCGVDCQKQDWPAHKLNCAKTSTQSTPKEDLTGMNEFHMVKHIGTGNFTTIFKGVSKVDGKCYAIKQAEKAKLTRLRKQADLFMQKHCLSKLKDCEYVVRLWRTFQDDLHLFMQMDYAEGGELWDQSRFYGVIGQSLYKYYVCQIIKAVYTIHEKYDIVHRDLKPENVLLTKEHKVKLIDFGTARDLSRPELKGSGNGLKGRKPFEHYVGTPHYMAPECIHNKASEKVSDVYSLSGLMYFLKVGSAPFGAASEYLVFTKSLENQLLLPRELFSSQLVDLIYSMNKKGMEERLPLGEVLKHEYFKGVDFENLPSYEEAVGELTEFQKNLSQLGTYLIEKYSNLHKEKVEVRQKVYTQEIVPYLLQWLERVPEEWKAQASMRMQVMRVQTEVMINLQQDQNICFAQLYRKLRGIQQPVLKKLNEEEVDRLDKEMEELKVEEGYQEFVSNE